MNTPLSVILAAELPDALSELEKSGTFFLWTFFGHRLDLHAGTKQQSSLLLDLYS